MQKEISKIIIFSLKNRREDYAKCLRILSLWLVNKKSEEQLKEMKELLQPEFAEVADITNPNAAAKYLEIPMMFDNDIRSIIENRRKISEKDLEIPWEKLRFHIRIKLDNSKPNLDQAEMLNFLYLALLLRWFKNTFFDRKQRRKLTVFIVPQSGNVFPFNNKSEQVDYETYKKVSYYLRLLSYEYNGAIFGVDYSKGSLAVNPLDFKLHNRFENYFPLLHIDENKYNILFDEKMDNEIFDELQLLKGNARFRAAGDENPNIAFKDFIIEASYENLKYKVRNVEAYIQEFKRIDGISIMQFALFCFTLCEKQDDSQKIISQLASQNYMLVEELTQGLRQIVQNSIQHSQLRECFFSFYMHQSMEGEDRETFCTRIRENYPNTCITNIGNNGRYEALEVRIADINYKDNILDNFISNLQSEMESVKGYDVDISGHIGLVNNKYSLALRNFFSEFEDTDLLSEWIQFRNEDLAAHVGLSVFALTMEQCNASFRIISNNSSKLQSERNLFYKAYSSLKQNEEKGSQEYVIPGTEFEILIPINDWENIKTIGIGQVQEAGTLKEDYESYGGYLEFEKEKSIIIDCPDKKEKFFADRLEKLKEVLKWQSLWNKEFLKLGDKKSLYTFEFKTDDLSYYFDSLDSIEVCIKGLISALNSAEAKENNRYIAIVNAPKLFIDTCIKLLVTLAGRGLPQSVQLFICENDLSRTISLMGNSCAAALQNSYVLSLEQGWNGIPHREVDRAKCLEKKLRISHEDDINNEIDVFPFDCFIKVPNSELTLYENHILDIARQPLDSQNIGYKIEDTHMKLGSKVHIEGFYEMSFLFYRTTVANKLAFIILRQLMSQYQETLRHGNILFYGYASYSKAILMSCSEMLRNCRKRKAMKSDNIGFAAYQHNLQLESEEIQMYFSIPSGFPWKENKDMLFDTKERINIIQIVPISSTLSTFDKMWDKLVFSVSTKENLYLLQNYTFFWVVDNTKGKSEIQQKPSDLEEKYWTESCKTQRITRMNFSALSKAGCADMHYLLQEAVRWQNPLKCEKCYPEEVINEYPLVETDPTSTVPAQQIRAKRLVSQICVKDSLKEQNNCARIMGLKECIYYGHISRRLNHYQYYIDTQKYFYEVKDQVKDWLRGMQNSRSYSQSMTLNIIFTPEHNTNVGFSQYVNSYYFHGLAEVVSINVDKVFRSNFICEHSALINLIRNLCIDLSDGEELPVKFYFVDDTIITGETLAKAEGLMTSLMPEEMKDKLPDKLIDKVFVLVERLSDDSKQRYVRNIDRDFLSFVHIDVSNVRTQGDSCIGCKLEQEAKRMFKRSSTKMLATYWAEKARDYQVIAYDGKEIKNLNTKIGFARLVLTHIVQNCIIKNYAISQVGNVYDFLLDMFQMILGVFESKSLHIYRDLIMSLDKEEAINALCKVVCRPFLNYDYKIRVEVMTLFIMLAEFEMGVEKDKLKEATNKKFLLEDRRIDRTFDVLQELNILFRNSANRKIKFLQSYIFDGLVDMNSNYLLRKQTISKVYKYIAEKTNENDSDIRSDFWNNYAISLFKLCSTHSDGARELELQTLLFTGEEYDQTKENAFTPKWLFTEITGTDTVEKKDVEFCLFCQDVFLQCTDINYDGIAMLSKDRNQSENVIDNYYMVYWKQLYNLERFEYPLTTNKRDKSDIEVQKKLRLFLKEERDTNVSQKSVKDWYNQLLHNIISLICKRYGIREEDLFATILTENEKTENGNAKVENLDIVTAYPEKSNMSERYYCVKENIIKSMEDKKEYNLDEKGYYISTKEDKKYIVLILENPDKNLGYLEMRNLVKTQRVYLYIHFEDIKTEDLRFTFMMISRMIMTYRNSILKYIEQDFASDIFAKYAHNLGQNNILSHEKAKSHNTTADDVISIEKFLKREEAFNTPYKVLLYGNVADWLLIRNYTNGQIAKLFNRSFHDDDIEILKDADTPPFYIRKDLQSGKPYMQALTAFSKLDIQKNSEFQDGRFLLLEQIVNIIYLDSVENANFIDYEGRCYNLEYFKCILVDIFLSAIKYESWSLDFLLRIDRFLEIEQKIQNPSKYARIISNLEKQRCVIEICKEDIPGRDAIEYLVVRNRVNRIAHAIFNYEDNNRKILHRLADPLDYADGHMSLITIKRYIEGISTDVDGLCIFRYVLGKDIGKEDDELYFETKLPVLRKEL